MKNTSFAGGSQRWLRLALATFALLLAGIIYAWSFLKAPLAELYGWDARSSLLQLNYTLTLCFFCIGGLISGFVSGKISARVRIMISGVLVFIGLFIVSRLTGKSAPALYLGYGILIGTGIGVIYNTLVAVTNAWFPDRKGVASGVMMVGFGFSAMVLGNLAVKLFDTAMGWRGVFLMYACVVGLGLSVMGLVVRPPKEGEVPAAAIAKATDGADYDTIAMLKKPSFWLLFVELVIVNAVCTVAVGQSRDLMLGINANALTVAAVGASMVSVMNGFGRLFWGVLFDKIGIARTRFVDCAILLASPIMLLIAIKTGSLALCFIALCLTGVAFSFAPTATTTYLLAFYGRKHFNMNLSVLTLTLIPGSFSSVITGGMTLTGTYIFLTVLACVGVVIHMFLKKA